MRHQNYHKILKCARLWQSYILSSSNLFSVSSCSAYLSHSQTEIRCRWQQQQQQVHPVPRREAQTLQSPLKHNQHRCALNCWGSCSSWAPAPRTPAVGALQHRLPLRGATPLLGLLKTHPPSTQTPSTRSVPPPPHVCPPPFPDTPPGSPSRAAQSTASRTSSHSATRSRMIIQRGIKVVPRLLQGVYSRVWIPDSLTKALFFLQYNRASATWGSLSNIWGTKVRCSRRDQSCFTHVFQPVSMRLWTIRYSGRKIILADRFRTTQDPREPNGE